MRSITLWRAATDDYVPDAASFARDRADAEAYLNNRGFGGPVLWKARVATDESRVLNLYDEQEPVDFLTHLLDMPHPGAIGVEEWRSGYPCGPMCRRHLLSPDTTGSWCASLSQRTARRGSGLVHSIANLPWFPRHHVALDCRRRLWQRWRHA